MDKDLIFNKINQMLEESEYPLEVSDINDVENFLNDDGNMSLEVYDEIASLYDQLLEEPDF